MSWRSLWGLLPRQESEPGVTHAVVIATVKNPGMYLHINIADNENWGDFGGGRGGEGKGVECNNETKGRSTYEAWVNS